MTEEPTPDLPEEDIPDDIQYVIHLWVQSQRYIITFRMSEVEELVGPLRNGEDTDETILIALAAANVKEGEVVPAVKAKSILVNRPHKVALNTAHVHDFIVQPYAHLTYAEQKEATHAEYLLNPATD